MLEMIQQKSMHRKCETGGLTAFSKAGAGMRFFEGAAVRFCERIHRKRRTFAAEFICYAISYRAAVQKTERHLNQLLYGGAGDLDAVRDRNVSWRLHTRLCEIGRFRGGRTWC